MGLEMILNALLGGVGGAAQSIGDRQDAAYKNQLGIEKEKAGFGNDLMKAIMVEMMKGRVKQGGGFGNALAGADPELIQHDPTAYIMKILMSGGGRRGVSGPARSVAPRTPLFNSASSPLMAATPPAPPPMMPVIDLSKFKRPTVAGSVR